MLYASPFMPQKSGISDYSEVLVYALKKKFDITLYVDNYKLDNQKLIKDFPIKYYGKDKIDFKEYDYLVYNIGNNPEFHDYIYETCLEHPGLVILHDLVLYYLFVGYYQKRNQLYSKTYIEEGLDKFLTLKAAVKKDGNNLLAQKNMASILPMNKELLQSGNKIMVHSQYARDKVLQYTENVRKINMIQQVAEDFALIQKEELFQRYAIPEDALIISSFGGIAQTKLNHVACKAVKSLAGTVNQKICYLMVGEGNYVDEYVDNKVIFKTGFVNMDEFNSFIEYSDIILNLRYPSMGETSASLLRILQLGKFCIINEGGWFSEIPKDCVEMLPVNNIESELKNALEKYIQNFSLREKIGMNAKRYIEKEYSEEEIVKEISEFIKE